MCHGPSLDCSTCRSVSFNPENHACTCAHVYTVCMSLGTRCLQEPLPVRSAAKHTQEQLSHKTRKKNTRRFCQHTPHDTLPFAPICISFCPSCAQKVSRCKDAAYCPQITDAWPDTTCLAYRAILDGPSMQRPCGQKPNQGELSFPLFCLASCNLQALTQA